MTKALMILGTTSNAGKSIVTAGLARVFKRKGYRVAPFKAQNMALNSFITKDGFEMGRAQVVQAEAAGIEPDVRMNPVLLKPSSDRKSQVIVMGKVYKTLAARDYYKEKDKLFPKIIEAFDSLKEDYDLILCEGAGSPSEINLKDQDMVNTGFAKKTQTPFVIVGDIDRGGVFASLAGTMLLFDQEERDLTRGFIINKFRGDQSILDPGLRQLEDITKVPVLGVLPYLDIDIEDEDSLSDHMNRFKKRGRVQIAVVRIPRISNATDFHALSLHPDVDLTYVTSPQELEEADMIIIPGSKSTMDDFKWMKERGLDSKILQRKTKGVPILGICGGYQMLGDWMEDPYGVESGGKLRGLGLLPMTTVFSKEKTTVQCHGRIKDLEGFYSCWSGLDFKGYEIHMGQSDLKGGQNLHTNSSESQGACQDAVAGTYVHGFLDQGEIIQNLVEALLKRKNLDPGEESFDFAAYKEDQFDKLADDLEKALDIDALEKMIFQA